jgi:spore germination protein YaaH
MKKILSQLILICTTALILLVSPIYGEELQPMQTAPQATNGKITRVSFLGTLLSVLQDDLSLATINNLDPSNLVELGKQHGIVVDSQYDLNQEITKKEAELMFIRAIGYDPVKLEIHDSTSLFQKMSTLGQTPEEKMIFEMYQKISSPLEELHGFYAMKSYAQLDLIQGLDSLSFGWSQIVFDESTGASLKIDTPGGLSIPAGFMEPITKAQERQIPIQLMVFASQGTQNTDGKGLVELILLNHEVKTKIIQDIIQQISNTTKDNLSASFDGVVIDFEEIKDPALAAPLNQFLQELKVELDKIDKNLYVAVQPKKYYKGYDYKVIGEIADKVILMAHDYHPRQIEALSTINPIENFSQIQSPLTPIVNSYNKDFDVYTALQEITDSQTGISDRSKISLQLSFNTMQWRKIEENGSFRIETANPTYDTLRGRLLKEMSNGTLNMGYNKQYENPYFTYYDQEKNVQNIIWYEDSRSILAKINLAKLFDIKDISIWRLGNIPNYASPEEGFMYLDTWQQIIKAKGSL